MASQITSLTIVDSTIYWGANQRKHQSSAWLAFVWEFNGDRWIPREMASNTENVSIWRRHHASEWVRDKEDELISTITSDFFLSDYF